MKHFLLLALWSLFSLSNVLAAEPTEKGKLNKFKINLGEQIYNQIERDPAYAEMFMKVYGENTSLNDILDAITEYKKSLESPARFDDYLKGNKNALTPSEVHGYQLFQSYGCAACHSGKDLGGTQFKQLGVVRNYIIERKTLLTPADLGLAQVSKNAKDIFVFRVPSLRNVAITYPYYHDGSIKSLQNAVYLMGKYQLGVEIPEKDVNAIVDFLNSLTAKKMENK